MRKKKKKKTCSIYNLKDNILKGRKFERLNGMAVWSGFGVNSPLISHSAPDIPQKPLQQLHIPFGTVNTKPSYKYHSICFHFFLEFIPLILFQARRKEVFIQERYGRFNLNDPFLALQRDYEAGAGDKEKKPVCTNPLSILEAVMAHCRKMQERMSTQLAAAESRQKKVLRLSNSPLLSCSVE